MAETLFTKLLNLFVDFFHKKPVVATATLVTLVLAIPSLYSSLTGSGFLSVFRPLSLSAAELCDAEAADPEDPDHVGQGVPNIINPIDVIKNCQIALKNTDVPRFHHQLARAFLREGSIETALIEFKTQADLGYMISAARYAQYLFANHGNISEARHYVLLAANGNCPYGIYLQGRWYLVGAIGNRSATDIQIGRELIEKAAEMKSPSALEYMISHKLLKRDD